jgi:hypothetical protein
MDVLELVGGNETLIEVAARRPSVTVMLAGAKSLRSLSLTTPLPTSTPPSASNRRSIGPDTRPYGAFDEKP